VKSKARAAARAVGKRPTILLALLVTYMPLCRSRVVGSGVRVAGAKKVQGVRGRACTTHTHTHTHTHSLSLSHRVRFHAEIYFLLPALSAQLIKICSPHPAQELRLRVKESLGLRCRSSSARTNSPPACALAPPARARAHSFGRSRVLTAAPRTRRAGRRAPRRRLRGRFQGPVRGQPPLRTTAPEGQRRRARAAPGPMFPAGPRGTRTRLGVREARAGVRRAIAAGCHERRLGTGAAAETMGAT